jgi:TonB family protein
MSARSSSRAFFVAGTVSFAAACASTPRVAPVLAPPTEALARQSAVDVYVAAQVTKPVAPEVGSASPRYPDVLRTAKIEGMVLMSFVVDTTGKIDMPSALILKAPDARFLPAVIAALPDMRFTPAKLDGHRVRQLVSQPYYFQNTDSTKAHGPQSIDQAIKTLTGSPMAPIHP